MIHSNRHGVNKHRAAKSFKRHVSKTHPSNIKMRGWMRGGIRL